ncbi:hypothetical protein LINGRAHAP2_LOCUS10446 [Linum grandiflorum]
MLLRDLSPGEPPPELRLHLRHVWKHCNRAQPDKFFAVGTAWTDAEGTRIQGDTLRPFAAYLESNVFVGSVYATTGFTLQPPRPSYRACRFPHWLSLGLAVKYELLPPDTTSAFARESYEFLPFAKFPGRLPPCPYLTGKTTASSGLASRIIQDPLHPAAESLRVQCVTACSLFRHVNGHSVHPTIHDRLLFFPSFAGQQGSVRYIVPKFDSPEKLTKHVQELYRIIRELDEMYVAAGDSCKKHDTVPSAVVAHRYRLKLLVSDSTSTSTFVLLGHAADRIMPIPASELVVAYPDDYGAPPPPLQIMIGQKVVFGVHLPHRVHASSYEDFRISKILGLNMPRAQLLAQLPPPRLPQRTPSPPSRHETPIPPDPAYVPPVPTYFEVSAVPNSDPIESSSLPRTTRRKAQAQPPSSDMPFDNDMLLSDIPLTRVKLENLASVASKPSDGSGLSSNSSMTASIPSPIGLQTTSVRKRLFPS